ncbi:TIM barrel protein [Roseibacillus persicicus]|uniref:Hydroxypyruvate isomerase n=1 Tax=Roseibacillus persicicus TaxID=454148 RepID=A0A918WJ82_9BACT|nr:TIM barrel protein [Roseibacillus persicicus]GHC50936.1 hydroxypyruvate isomerase [Roseibacillus persicicus]
MRLSTNRRRFLATCAAATPALLAGQEKEAAPKLKGNIKQVIAAWPFNKAAGWTYQQLIKHAQDLGVAGIELFPAEDLPLLKGTGLVCGATKSHTFVRGMNNKGHHAECFEILEKTIKATSEAGFPNVMTFTGLLDTSQEPNGSVVTREEGFENCVAGYRKIAPIAEKAGVTLVLEPLNTRNDEAMKGHPGYQGDHIDECVEIIKAVNSPGLRLLFDAYHIQVMDGDLIKRFEQHKDLIAHVQVAGNPGRGEIGDEQEINYRGLMKAILKSGYTGYVGHEWIPTGDALEGLQNAVSICDV